MRKLIQKRMGPIAITGPIAEDINEQLNLSAHQILATLARTDWINFARGSVGINTNGTTKEIPLPISDMFRPVTLIDATGPSTDNSGFQITESKRHEYWSRYPTGQDEQQRWIYYFEYNPGSSQPYKLVFLGIPPALSREVIYIKKVSEISVAPTTGNDALSYNEIPPEHHEIVVEHALAAILAHLSNPLVQAATQYLGDLVQSASGNPALADKGKAT